jgi:predicted RNA-binding Zn ribbon-like protein
MTWALQDDFDGGVVPRPLDRKVLLMYNYLQDTNRFVRCQVQFSHYKSLPLQLAVDLVNSLDVMDNLETLDVDGVAGLLEKAEIENPPEVIAADLNAVKSLRSHVRDVFESESQDVAAQRVNRILQHAQPIPFVGVHENGPHIQVAPRKSSPADWLGAIIGMELADLVCRYGTDRFGVCSADDCRDVFIDISRNHSRKHCSDRCTNREGVRSFRRRAADH